MSSPSPSVVPSNKAIRLITLGCLVSGAICFFFFIPSVFGWQDVDDVSDDFLAPRVGYLLWHIVAGIISLSLMPGALRQTRENSSPRPLHLVIATVCIFTGSSSILGGPAGIIVFITTVSRLTPTTSIVAVAAAFAGGALDIWISPDGPNPWFLIGVAVLIALAFIPGQWLGNRRLNKRAAISRAADDRERIRREERLRIARDMHDTLSHRLSLIAVHAGAVEYRADLAPGQVQEQAGHIRAQAEEAVTDLRRTLKLLREETTDLDPRSSLVELVEQATTAGMDVSVVYQDIEPEKLSLLDTMASHCVHRTIQETLTNARKHAPGMPVRIALSKTLNDARLAVTVTNPKIGMEAPTNSGSGLIGLMERATLADGSLTIDDTNEFTVLLELPWRIT